MIITFLGKGFKTEKEKRAYYRYDDFLSTKFELKKDGRYTNMLPLLIDNFDEKIIPIYTKEAEDTQKIFLEDEFGKSYEEIFDEDYFIEDTKDFSSIMKILNKVLQQDNEYILDLTHSFRHLPILATISLISNHNINKDNIKHIFFAKEEIPASKDVIGKYQIIDLKNYIELADVSYMLSTFNQNYTISGNIKFSNPLYQQLANELKKFSEHFLSNSLKAIIEDDLIDNIFSVFNELEKKEDIVNLKSYIKEIKRHLSNIQKIKEEKYEYKKLYKLSQIMDKRGYQLNAITLLFEATGYYCLEAIYKNTTKAKAHIDRFKKFIDEGKEPENIYSNYTLVYQSRTIIKKLNRFNNSYLFNPETIDIPKKELPKKLPKKESNIIKYEIIDFANSLSKNDFHSFKKFLGKLESFRNNLSHGNSSEQIEDVEIIFERFIENFEKFCIKKNILKL